MPFFVDDIHLVRKPRKHEELANELVWQDTAQKKGAHRDRQ